MRVCSAVCVFTTCEVLCTVLRKGPHQLGDVLPQLDVDATVGEAQPLQAVGAARVAPTLCLLPRWPLQAPQGVGIICFRQPSRISQEKSPESSRQRGSAGCLYCPYRLVRVARRVLLGAEVILKHAKQTIQKVQHNKKRRNEPSSDTQARATTQELAWLMSI